MSTFIKEDTVQQVEYTIDTETGELQPIYGQQEIKQTRIYTTKEEFIQVYLNDISGLLNIASKTELQILMILWKYSSYNEEDNKGNFVIINPKIIADISISTGVKEQSVRNALSSLIKNPKKPLIKDKQFRATYYLNPVYFFKGALKDRPKVMRYVLEYVDKQHEEKQDN